MASVGGQLAKERVDQVVLVDVDPGTRRLELAQGARSLAMRERQQTEQRDDVPPPVHEALEACTLARPALRDPDELAPVDGDLTGAETAEADLARPRGVDG